MFDTHSLEAYSTIATAPSPATSGTSATVQTGDGANFAIGQNLTVCPAGAQPTKGNSEIVRVTAISTDTLTITRTQEGSSARTIVVGDQIFNAITPKVFTDIEKYVNPIGSMSPFAGRAAPTNWLFCDGSAVSRTTYSALFGVIAPVVGTFTVTIATPAVVSLTNHGFVTGDAVYLTTTGALPTGLSANTIYYVIKTGTSTFNLATTVANAFASTAIATSGTQSGTHTANACPYGLGDGSTTFNVPDLRGRVPAGNDSMNGTAASRLTNPTTVTINGLYGTLGASGGAETHLLLTAQMPSHNHTFNYLNADAVAGGSFNRGIDARGTATGVSTGTTGNDTAHNNVQPSLVVNYIIKT